MVSDFLNIPNVKVWRDGAAFSPRSTPGTGTGKRQAGAKMKIQFSNRLKRSWRHVGTLHN